MGSYNQISDQVQSLENQAKEQSDEAQKESRMADGLLKDIAKLEQTLPPSLKVKPVQRMILDEVERF